MKTRMEARLLSEQTNTTYEGDWAWDLPFRAQITRAEGDNRITTSMWAFPDKENAFEWLTMNSHRFRNLKDFSLLIKQGDEWVDWKDDAGKYVNEYVPIRSQEEQDRLHGTTM